MPALMIVAPVAMSAKAPQKFIKSSMMRLCLSGVDHAVQRGRASSKTGARGCLEKSHAWQRQEHLALFNVIVAHDDGAAYFFERGQGAVAHMAGIEHGGCFYPLPWQIRR